MILKKLDHKKSKAQAMVEFAIALPVLLLLLYGIIETGRLVFMYSTVVNASRQAVRYGSTTGNGNGTGNANETNYQDCDGIRAAAQKVGFIGAFGPPLISYDTGPSTTATPYCVSTSAQTDPLILTGNVNRINVTVSKQFVPIVPKLVPFLTRTITASSSRSILISVSISVTQAAPILETPTITIVSDNLDPSNVGEAVTVVVNVTSTTTPTGTVTITSTDPASTTCTITLPATSCTMIFNTGSPTGSPWVITAAYNGDSTHATKSVTTTHAVKYSTATTITAHIPDPSTTNQNVAVTVTVASGLAIPNGTVVKITGANTNCNVTLTSGTGSCNVVFTTTGTKTLTATYAGDANHSASSSTATHDVLVNNNTITRITSLAPEPSVINQLVTVSVKVVGLTIPTGTVTITGANTNCTITLSGGTGSCNVNFTTAGGKSITATYNGNGVTSLTSSTSTGHTVNLPATTTAITTHTPDPSSPGQTVNVTVTVTGVATTPTGTITITGGDTPCTITLPATSCNVVFSTTGTKTLSAVYSGDTQNAPSSITASHVVDIPVVSPVPSCNGITHGPIAKSGNTMSMSMTITNPYNYPLTTGSGSVTWNDDKGSNTGNKKLALLSATLGGTTIWFSGPTAVNVSTMPFTIPATLPANTTVSIIFTFDRSYDNFNGLESIFVNLTTQGCTGLNIKSP